MKRILIIGGTGIVGKAIIEESLKRKFETEVICLVKSKDVSKNAEQIVVDRNDDKGFKTRVSKLGKFDIVVDIIEFSKGNSKQTYDCFKNLAKHIFILSTVLVYDRSKNYKLPIRSSHRLSKRGLLGGYVDHKLEVENFWNTIKDANWTILRPYHILGVHGSLLGCIPEHNRDPELLEKIMNEDPLELCETGNIKINFIDSRDLAKMIFAAANNARTFHKSYNLVNPKIFTAREYYEIIAKELGKNLIVKNKSVKEVWKENKGWQLTTLPHVYDVTDLEKDIGFVPKISLRTTIKEIIKRYEPTNKKISEMEVHRRMTLPPRPKPLKWLLDEKRKFKNP